MSALLTKIQQQKLSDLAQQGLGFADEAEATDLDSLLPADTNSILEISLGHICNNICSFCVSGHLTQQGLAKPIPSPRILQVIKHAYEKGMRQLILLGGEPTIQKNFFPALEAAVQLGFEKIIVFTNLVRGKDQAFLKHVSSYPGVYWRISIQGGNEQTHDQVVKRQGAFNKIQHGLTWLHQHNQPVSINSCITTESVSSIPDYATLLTTYHIKHLHLDMFRPSSAGRKADEYALDLIPDYQQVAANIQLLLGHLRSRIADLSISIGGLPYCFLPDYAHLIHHGGESTYMVSVADGEGKGWDKYSAQDAGRFHTPACKTCVFHQQCHGLPIGYGIKFGTPELHPITLPKLIQVPPLPARRLQSYSILDGNHQWQTWSPHMRKIAKRIALLYRSAPYDGWHFVRDMILPQKQQAAVLFQKNEETIVVYLHGNKKINVEFIHQTSLLSAKKSISAMIHALNR